MKILHSVKLSAIRILSIVLVYAMLLPLTGCRREIVRTEHEIFMQLGETVQLTPGNIPEGKSAENYTWDCGRLLTLSEAGCITANEMGASYASAVLNYRGKEYFEYFKVTVETVVNEITLDVTQAVMRAGNRLDLTALLDINMPIDEKIKWKSSDESVVTVAPNGVFVNDFHDLMSVVRAVGAGTATVTAYYGDTEAQCQITVYDPQNADEMLTYIDAWQQSCSFTCEGTQIVEMEDFKTLLSVGELDEIGSAPNGKYLVLWDDEAYADIDAYACAYDYTALLPPEYRPQCLAEVEYILRVVEGEPIHAGIYENGVKGYVRTADFVIENAVTGEIIKTIESLQGSSLPDKIIDYGESMSKEYYGSPVKMSRFQLCLLNELGKLWTDHYNSVSFLKGSKARMLYGDKVTLPESVCSISLYTIGSVSELIVPPTVTDISTETYILRGIKKVIVTEGSFAEKWFTDHTDAEITVLPKE